MAKSWGALRNESPEFRRLVDIEYARLILQETVVRHIGRASPNYTFYTFGEKAYYSWLSKKTGWSVRRLKKFFESSSDIHEAAEILHKLGYRIADIKVKKIKKSQPSS